MKVVVSLSVAAVPFFSCRPAFAFPGLCREGSPAPWFAQLENASRIFSMLGELSSNANRFCFETDFFMDEVTADARDGGGHVTSFECAKGEGTRQALGSYLSHRATQSRRFGEADIGIVLRELAAALPEWQSCSLRFQVDPWSEDTHTFVWSESSGRKLVLRTAWAE